MADETLSPYACKGTTRGQRVLPQAHENPVPHRPGPLGRRLSTLEYEVEGLREIHDQRLNMHWDRWKELLKEDEKHSDRLNELEGENQMLHQAISNLNDELKQVQVRLECLEKLSRLTPVGWWDKTTGRFAPDGSIGPAPGTIVYVTSD